ncbi:MAG TPA: helix-turn-helix domain-containing protein, partial [Thermoleophilia bacterium]|nr:helix-turn-helix domain-containing protein [Thermoleophilia bacterium]
MSGTSQTHSTERRWLRLGPAAELLGVSVNTLRRWSDGGKIECYRSAGGHRRFRRSDIEAILAGQAGAAAARRGPRLPGTASGTRPAVTEAAGEGDGALAEIARLQVRNWELELLVEAGIEDASRLSTKEVLESVTSRLSRVTRSPVADIYAVEGDSLRALVSYDHGSFDRSWEGTVVRLRDFPCSVIAVDQRRLAVASSLDDPVLTEKGRASLEKWGYQAQLSVPLIAHGDVIGILELS